MNDVEVFFEEELWWPIPGYAAVYDASTHGGIRSWLDLTSPPGQGLRSCATIPHLLTPYVGGDNRPMVNLRWPNGRYQARDVARLVLLTFRAYPGAPYLACHRNDCPRDNRLANLYWGTPVQNGHDAVRNGRLPYGTRHCRTILTPEQVRQARQLRATGQSWTRLAAHLGQKASTIRAAVTGRSWAHLD